MIALYRVHEPDPPGNQAALDPEVSQQLWNTTTHNFTPTETGSLGLNEYELYGWELVVLHHRPNFKPTSHPALNLASFEHPANAVYLIGPDSRNLEFEDIPQHFQGLRRHYVFIPTGSLHPMFGHVVWSVVYWDRMMKLGGPAAP